MESLDTVQLAVVELLDVMLDTVWLQKVTFFLTLVYFSKHSPVY